MADRVVERVEIRPGVLVNMRPEDRKVWEKSQQQPKPDGLVTSQIETADAPAVETADVPTKKRR